MNAKDLNPFHQEILRDLKRVATRTKSRYRPGEESDRGSSKPGYAIRTVAIRNCVKDWIRRHPDLTPAEYLQLLDSLSRGETSNEFYVIGELLQHLRKLRGTLKPQRIIPWLGRAEGWLEVDVICQSKFTAEELLANWHAWKRVLNQLSGSKNVHQRRASLVLLTKPIHDSTDARIANIALTNIERLKHEHDILITKAISWLLRACTANHRRQVETYLRMNADSLPKVAIRETQNKLQTGLKSGLQK